MKRGLHVDDPPRLQVLVGGEDLRSDLEDHLVAAGPSPGAHLHFGLVDRPSVFAGRALPFVFDHYPLWGSVQNFP